MRWAGGPCLQPCLKKPSTFIQLANVCFFVFEYVKGNVPLYTTVDEFLNELFIQNNKVNFLRID